MTWIVRNERAWRTAVLAIAAVAFVGPWAYEALSVPAEYACPPHNFRLEGDYCGSPVLGLFVLLWIISGLSELVRALAMVELGRVLRISSVLLALALALLPLLTTLIVIVGRGGRSKLQVAAWGLAATAIPFFALVGLSRFHPALWGVWLYFGLAVIALVLEMATYFAERELSPG